MSDQISILQPAGYVSLNALAFASDQGLAVRVAAHTPLPVSATATGDVGATSVSLAGMIGDSVAHLLGPFTPQLSRSIWATLVGTGASGTAQLLRSTDAGATKAGLTAAARPWASWSFSALTGSIVNEQIGTETDASATYYLAVTLTAGSITYRIAQ